MATKQNEYYRVNAAFVPPPLWHPGQYLVCADAEIAALRQRIEELEAENADLEAQLESWGSNYRRSQ